MTCNLPTVIDLTRRSEECHPKASSIDALRVVKSSSWYTNSGSSKGLPSPGPASDHRLPSGDQIQPDDAFSNTTVMLSYVSRSHIFSSHDSLSQHTPLCGVPSINKLSLHANPYKLGEGSEEMDEVHPSQDVNQYYLQQQQQQMESSLGLEPQSKLLRRSTSPTRVASETASGVCRTQQQSHEVNGGHAVTNGTGDKHRHGGVPPGHSHTQGTASRKGIRSSRRSGVRVESSLEGRKAESGERPERGDSEERPERGDSEVLFLISRTENPVVIQDSQSPRDLCALGREFASPLEDPVSPSATSLEDVEEVFLLPQASSSPSADNSLAGDALDTSWDELERLGQETCSTSDTEPLLLDSCGRYQEDAHARTATSDTVIDLTDDCSVPDVLEEEEEEEEGQVGSPHMNGNAREEQSSFERKKLPPRSGRGTRLETIVMNINPTWYKVAGAMRPNKKIKPPQSQIRSEMCESEAVRANKDSLSVVTRMAKDNIALSSERETKLHSEHTLNKGNSSIHTIANTDSCKESTSDSERTRFPKHTHNSITPKTSSLLSAIGHGSAADVSQQLSDLKPLSVVEATGVSQGEKPEQETPSKHKGKSSGSKASPTAKSKPAPPPKRKRKKPSAMQSSMFAPNEPEIKLKYINYKEEKRDHRATENFSPFIRVERKRSPSTCTVINYPDEDGDRLKKGHQQPSSGGFIPGAVPTTSCLQLGRVSSHSQYQNALVCCLCGGSANAMDLGDLHGPYYPEGYRPSTKTAASAGLKEEEEEEEDSDSDSSFRARGRKGARPPGVWPHRPGPRLSQEGLLGKHPGWTSCTDSGSSPAAKRARTEPGTEALDGTGVLAGAEPGAEPGAGAEAGAGALAREDWYAPPVVPLQPCEYWLHEDCSIWSAGVFLVKGKVYGLEEAVKVAHQTTCSGCHRQGATIGCFFKGCPNKYHYRCALQSDCVLTEENFSMKCRRHKNKSLKAPLGGRCDSR